MSEEPGQINDQDRREQIERAKAELAKEELNSWHQDRGLKELSPDEEVKPVEWMCHEIFTSEAHLFSLERPKLVELHDSIYSL
jgi:hypothetical protein